MCIEQPPPGTELKPRESIARFDVLGRLEARNEVNQERCERLAASAGGSGCCSAEPGAQRGLRAFEASPQPVTGRQGKRGRDFGEPGCSSGHPTEDGLHEVEQRDRSHNEARHHGAEHHRESPPTASSAPAVRAEKAPSAHDDFRTPLGVAAQKAVPDELPGDSAVRTADELDLKQYLVESSAVRDETGTVHGGGEPPRLPRCPTPVKAAHTRAELPLSLDRRARTSVWPIRGRSSDRREASNSFSSRAGRLFRLDASASQRKECDIGRIRLSHPRTSDRCGRRSDHD